MVALSLLNVYHNQNASDLKVVKLLIHQISLICNLQGICEGKACLLHFIAPYMQLKLL